MDQHQADRLIEQNRAVYNRIAPLFSETRAELWEDLKPLGRFAQDGDRVLDLGCGNGRLNQLFAGISVEYVGVDQSEELLDLARQTYPRGHYILADMRSVPLPDDHFDAVYSIAALHHLPTRESRVEALMEMKRLAKPDAPVVITNWNLLESDDVKTRVARGEWKVIGENHFLVPWKNSEGEVLGERYYHGFTFDELEALAREADLQIIEQYFTKRGQKTEAAAGPNMVSILSA